MQMPRVFNQKIKILYLMRVFLERTDEEHPMSVKDLIIYLNSLGISAERKTIYDDIGRSRQAFIWPAGNLNFRN